MRKIGPLLIASALAVWALVRPRTAAQEEEGVETQREAEPPAEPQPSWPQPADGSVASRPPREIPEVLASLLRSDLTTIGVVGVLIYSCGWLTRASAINNLGLGSLDVSRESSVAAGTLFAAMILLPAAMTYALMQLPRIGNDLELPVLRRFLQALYVLGVIGLTCLAEYISLFKYRIDPADALLQTNVIYSLITRYVAIPGAYIMLWSDLRPGGKEDAAEPSRALSLIAALVAVGISLMAFGYYDFPYIKTGLGGFYMRPALVVLKTPAGGEKPAATESKPPLKKKQDEKAPPERRVVIVDSDKTHVIVIEQNNARSQLKRWAWSDIESVTRNVQESEANAFLER